MRAWDGVRSAPEFYWHRDFKRESTPRRPVFLWQDCYGSQHPQDYWHSLQWTITGCLKVQKWLWFSTTIYFRLLPHKDGMEFLVTASMESIAAVYTAWSPSTSTSLLTTLPLPVCFFILKSSDSIASPSVSYSHSTVPAWVKLQENPLGPNGFWWRSENLSKAKASPWFLSDVRLIL